MGNFYTNFTGIEMFTRQENIASGLESNNLVIQSANVFLIKDGKAKLGDMNVSKIS